MVMTEPIDLWVDPLLRQLWHEQKKVSEMQDTELVAYVLDSKDKMPLRKPFPHNHKEVANHKKLRAHVGEVTEDLIEFKKLATKAEAKTMRAISRVPSSGCSSKSLGLTVAPLRSAPHRTALRRLVPTRRENTTTVQS